MARPLVGVAIHDQVGCRGRRLQPRLPARGLLDAHMRPPARAAATHGHGRLATVFPWQGGCRWARATIANVGATTAAQ
ncbi:hypothetical protein B296_00037025 [Ensete ventricosum]|uniref:Uncharacterized protein n=1 Tax=Ensete ventricosum TaxID=4639 RepID=A0A426WYE5_ENSVE|nr:hypothetical protein B296_00037025 [Ensete ventricosum]